MAKNLSQSIYQKLRNYAKENNIDTQAVLRRYVQERLMYRLSISKYSKQFVLKGGVLLSLYNNGNLLRPSDDIDFNGYNKEGNVYWIKDVVSEISKQDIHDGLIFFEETLNVQKDRIGIIPGGKVSIMSQLATARIELKIDVGFGNPIIPSVKIMKVPTLLSDIVEQPTMQTYPLETVISEKIHAMVQFGLINTRLKDYYDIYSIVSYNSFEFEIVKKAIETTFKYQEREIPDNIVGLSAIFLEQNKNKWNGFIKNLGENFVVYDFNDVIKTLSNFVDPILSSILNKDNIELYWDSNSKSWNNPNYIFKL